MNLQDIEAYVAVAETGSISRAALRLSLTQPATTRRIQNFEQAIGETPLFDRSVKPATLTAFGNYVLEHCRRVLSAVAELEASSTKAAAPFGDLKIGVAHGLGEMVLTSPFDSLRRAFPQVKLRVSSNWTANLVESVRSGELDCAVGLLTDAHNVPPGLSRVPLGQEEVVVVAPRRAGGPHRLRDLVGEGWFLNPPGCGCRNALIRAFDRQQLTIQIAAEVFGEDLQMSLLAQGSGLGLVPRRQFEQSPHRQTLQILELTDFALPATVTLIRNAASGRFDAAMGLLSEEMKTKLSA
jgi:DNA-binding transcriptional LysR family regulator